MASGDATPMYSFPQWYPLNQQAAMINCHRMQVPRKKTKRRRKKSCFCYSAESRNKSTFNTVVALSFFLILIVVLTIAAMAIYVGMEIILDGSLRVTYGDVYTTELFNRTSQLFNSKAHIYKIMIEKVFAKSILGPSIKQCVIMGFRNGSLIVFYRLILDRRKIPGRISLEETAKKILYDEITSLNPSVFTHVHLDPREIILKKHSINAETEIETDIVESTIEEVTISNLKNLNGFKRLPHSTPPLVRSKSSNPAVLGPTTSQTPNRSKSTKKPQSMEKTNKIKLGVQLPSERPSSSSPVLKKPNTEINKNVVNRYSFVSDDDQRVNHSSPQSENSVRALGEAEVIIVPVGAEGEMNVSAKREEMPKWTKGHIDRMDHDSLSRSKNQLSNQSDTILNRNISLNVPTRSNVALTVSLRPKPTPLNSSTRPFSTVTSPTAMSTSITHEEQIDRKEGELWSTTQDAVIVLNTEVVTSTSMQISYGQQSSLQQQPSADLKEDNFTVTSHKVQPVLPSSQLKYKNIFPRSIREEKLENAENQKNVTHSFLSFIIDRYKKQPSNETLHLIIGHIASIYTKSTPSTPMKNLSNNGFHGLLMTRPMNKVITSTTSSVTKSTEVMISSTGCEGNATKKCNNGKCILEHLWCNQFADCADGSDEKNCTCADYMKAQFSFSKICDGIVDCWDFSDENLCEWCSPAKHVCANGKLCINEEKVCDGYRDCPLGDDEKNCITISQFAKSSKTDFVYQSTGVITIKRSGIWGKLCNIQEYGMTKAESWSNLQELGQAVCKTMTFKNFVNISGIQDMKNEIETVYYKLNAVTRNSTNTLRRKNFKFSKTNCDNGEVVQVTCNNLECGVQTQIVNGRVHGRYRGERRSRIVGGGSSTLGAWPWQAALYREGEFQCGATLISSKWLLSAGHCFHNALKDYWVARLGILRRSSTLMSPHEQIRHIQRIIVHPHYMEADFINDISLLEMNSEVYITNFVRPICLPITNNSVVDGTLCTVIGWGQMIESGGAYPDTLQEVQLPVMSPAECRKRTAFLPLYKITDAMMCAGFDRGGKDACLGDSGGPLMCKDDNGSWRLNGVTSNGNGCARAHRPGIYTKVANYLNWMDTQIKSTINGAKLISPSCKGFRCPLGECLPKARICNGYMECSDGSDEHEC